MTYMQCNRYICILLLCSIDEAPSAFGHLRECHQNLNSVAAPEEEEEEEVDEQEQRKRRQSRRRGRKGRRVVEEEEEPDIDEETGRYDHENNENDVILNIVEGSDPDEEDELEHVIPRLKTL